MNLGQYGDVFIEDGFEVMDTIMTLTDQDLIEMNIKKKGHRRQILLHIQKYKKELEDKGDDINYVARIRCCRRSICI